jgi:hypothetical protein
LSFPIIPNITPTISVSIGQTVPLLLASIALEELSLAHIINAEAEKLQFVLGTLDTGTTLSPPVVTLSNLLAVNSSVQRTLRDVIKKEMLLEFKFENVLELLATIPPPPPSIVTVTLNADPTTICASGTGTPNESVLTGQVLVDGSPPPAGTPVSFTVSNPLLGTVIPNPTMTDAFGNFSAVFTATDGPTPGVTITATALGVSSNTVDIIIVDCTPVVIARFLYVSNRDDNTVEIYDIINPTAPVRVGQFNGANLNGPFGLAITGTTLYVANQFDDTVEIYDISTPAAPVRVGEFNAGNLNVPVGMAITGATLYVTNFGDNTVEIYDISTPAAPVRVGEFGAGDLVAPVGLAITGTTLYVSNNGVVEIYDISTPAAPVRVGEFGAGDLNGPIGLAITGTTLYVANNNDNTVEIYDISTPAAPVNVGQFNGANLNGPVGLAITGTTLYVTNIGDNTVEMYDISTPTAPVRVGEFGAGDLVTPVGLAIFTLLS